MKKISLAFLALVLCLSAISCRRRKLQPEELERNRFFAKILQREDSRSLGNDGFLENTLAGAPDAEVRGWAAVAFGRIGDPRGLPPLYEALHAREASVRAAAAFAVGEIEDRDLLRQEGRAADPRAVAAVSGLLDDPSIAVRGRACEALGKIASSAAEIARRLDTLPYDATPLQRSYLDHAITAFLRIKDPAALPLLRKLGTSGDPEIQWRAANALIRLKDKEATALFLKLLGSPNQDVRAYAARGVGVSESPELAERLFGLVSPSNPISVRICAVQSLGKLRNPSALLPIANALSAVPVDDAHPDQVNFAIQAASALADLPGPGSEPLLARLAQGSGPAANAAVIALARTLKGNPDRFFATVREEQFSSPPARRAWAQALAALGGAPADAGLRRMLERAVAEKAETADILAVPSVLNALAKLEIPDLAVVLKPFLTSPDPVVLRTAAGVYKPAPGSKSPWAPVLEAYQAAEKSGELETKVSVLGSLERWAGESVVQETLRAALRDRQRNVRIAAARILRAAGAPDVPGDPGGADGAPIDLCRALATVRKDRTVAVIETNRGEIELELFSEDAPLTVANFVALAKRGTGRESFQARRGFFDGLSFMRVVPFFVVQGGDPRNDQEGGPGYSIRCEINMRPYERGSLGMALAGKDTGSSQFFITLAPQPHLDGGYTCFGRVISGMQVVERLIPGNRMLKVSIREETTLFDQRAY